MQFLKCTIPTQLGGHLQRPNCEIEHHANLPV